MSAVASDTKSGGRPLDRADIYPLIDAMGFPVKVKTLNKGGSCMLTGSISFDFVCKELGFDIKMRASTVTSMVTLYTYSSTSAVLVHVAGNLHLCFLQAHNRPRLEVLVLDGKELGKATLLPDVWSRKDFIKKIAPHIRAHFLQQEDETGAKVWQETPDAPRWAQDYINARGAYQLCAEDGVLMADLLAFGMIERTPEAMKKWAISTPARRDEDAARYPSGAEKKAERDGPAVH